MRVVDHQCLHRECLHHLMFRSRVPRPYQFWFQGHKLCRPFGLQSSQGDDTFQNKPQETRILDPNCRKISPQSQRSAATHWPGGANRVILDPLFYIRVSFRLGQ